MIRCVCLLLLTTLSLPAETRAWRSADGSKSFRGELVRITGDSVTIRNDQGKELTFPLSKLHADDQAWITAQKKPKAAQPDGILGGLVFGESKEKTAARIKAGKVIVSDATQTKVRKNMFGTTDVIGNCRTAASFSGKPALIEFLWGSGESLEGINLRAMPHPESAYDAALKKTWEELAAYLVELQGEPAQSSPYPAKESVPAGGIMSTHSWRPTGGGMIVLGITRTAEGAFQPAAIFSREAKQPD